VCSMTIRTARCLTSSEYRIELFMTPSSQRVESPVNPGRFIQLEAARLPSRSRAVWWPSWC